MQNLEEVNVSVRDYLDIVGNKSGILTLDYNPHLKVNNHVLLYTDSSDVSLSCLCTVSEGVSFHDECCLVPVKLIYA